MADEHNRRNTEAAFEIVRQADVLARDTRALVDTLANTVAGLSLRLDNLEQAVNLLRIAAMGKGPTERMS